MRTLLIFIPAFFVLPCLCYSKQETEVTAAQLIEDLANSKDKFKAIDGLHQLGVLAFPKLFEHLDDERYCLTEDSMTSARKYKLSVGAVCRRIIDRQIRHYVQWENEPDPRLLPGHSARLVPFENEEARAWWEKNRNKELWELQAEFIDLVVQANKERLTTLEAGTKRNKCLDAISNNMKLAESIRRDKKPMQSKPFRPYSEK